MFTKATLLQAIAGKNRGLLASEQDKQAILVAIANLEDLNPTPRPLEAVIYLMAIGDFFTPPARLF